MMDPLVYLIIKHAHSATRWLLLVALVVSVGYSFHAVFRRTGLSASGILFSRITMYLAHFQLLIGIILYLISPKVIFDMSSMKDPILRFHLVQHLLAMMVAITLITLGYAGLKKAGPSHSSSRRICWYYGIALLLILLLIPWPFLSYGAGWI
jgi:hypothetical protein